MDERSKEEQEKIISSFKKAMSDICELQNDILEISEESLETISSNIVNKFHCFSTKETAHDFLLHIVTSIQIRPLKVPLYGKLLFKISKYLAPFTSQQELMTLFSSSKLIILNLFEANLITIDTIINYQQKNDQYIFYFCNEIRNHDPIYFGDLITQNEELEDFVLSISPEEHDRKRRLCLNDGKFETMIREDKIPSIHPNKQVSNSIYENSDFLSNISYAEYAAYFGSTKVLQHFLEYEDVKKDRLITFSIAGCQKDSIFLLINNQIKITNECIRTSIEFQTAKEIEIQELIKKSCFESKNDVNCSENFVKISDLYFSMKKLNWNFFIDNLLFVSDQINDPCCDDETKFTLLHFACSIGHKEVVKLLLSLFGDKNYFEHDYENDTNFDYIGSNNTYKSLINVNAQDKSKRTPLHLAVFNQKVDIVKILFKCDDIDFGIQDVKGKAAVHYAAETKNMEIIKLFVDSSPNHEIDMNIPDQKGNTAFHYFCKPRCFEPSILKYICDSTRIDPNQLNHKNVTELMHSIIKKKRIKIFEVLVTSDRVDLNFQTPKRKETALMIASQYNNFEAAKILMNDADRIDPNLQDFKLRTALHIAVHYASVKIFELLIKQPKVNMNIIDDFELTPVFSSLYKHRFNFFESFLVSYNERKLCKDQKYAQNNIDLNHRDHFSQNLLHYIIRCRYLTNMDFFLKIYSINEPDSKGTNAFHHACSIGFVDVIEYLINQLGTTTDEEENNCVGLYNSSMDNNGISSLKMEEKKIVDDLKIARYKPGEKIRINQKDSNGLTPFHYACQSNSIDTVNCLLSIPGIKIDEKDMRGETPFFYACKCGFFEIAKIVFKTNKIDPYTENFKDISALSCLSEQDQKNLFL